LLDFGCGDGDFLLEAMKKGWYGRGVDRDRLGTDLHDLKIVTELDELGEGSQFDCATFWHVLEHLEDPVSVLADLRGWLKPGGVVVAAVPNFGSWQARTIGASWIHLDVPRHISHFTSESLSKTFEMSGYRVEQISFGELEYDVLGWSQGLLNLGFGDRNEFFKTMSGRPGRGSIGHAAFHLAAGLGLSMISVLPAWIESRIGRGGTLIIRGRIS
jgi:SAM-dependent methyltransferase